MRSDVPQEEIGVLGCCTDLVPQLGDHLGTRLFRCVAVLSAAKIQCIDLPIENAELMLLLTTSEPDLEAEVWRADWLDFRYILRLEGEFLLGHDGLVLAPELPLLVFWIWFSGEVQNLMGLYHPDSGPRLLPCFL